MDLKGKQVLVFGAGRSGVGAATLLLERGALPVLYDGNEKLTQEKVREQFPDGGKDVRIVIGELTDELIASSDLCVISPGVPTDIPPVCRIREAGVKIWGEVELAWQCSKGQVLAVTGTNGKTTTVTLLGDLMISSPCIRDHEYNSGSSEPPSHDGRIYPGEGEDRGEPESRRYPDPES